MNTTTSEHTINSTSQREATALRRAEWAKPGDLWRGVLQGKDIGTGATLLFYATDTIGDGPRLHVHEYDEIFIVRTGRALFTVGDKKIEASAGDILIGPANVPHKYHNLGPGPLETTDIHLSETWTQIDLDDPEV